MKSTERFAARYSSRVRMGVFLGALVAFAVFLLVAFPDLDRAAREQDGDRLASDLAEHYAVILLWLTIFQTVVLAAAANCSRAVRTSFRWVVTAIVLLTALVFAVETEWARSFTFGFVTFVISALVVATIDATMADRPARRQRA